MKLGIGDLCAWLPSMTLLITKHDTLEILISKGLILVIIFNTELIILLLLCFITELEQSCTVDKLGSEVAGPEMVKKMVVQFLIEEVGWGE